MKMNICDKMYSLAEDMISDVFKKRNGYIDDWIDHGYEDAVHYMYVHLLEVLVKRSCKNVRDVESLFKPLTLSRLAAGFIRANDGEEFGFE